MRAMIKSHDLDANAAKPVENLRRGFDPNSVPGREREVLDAVIEEYGAMSGSQLENLTHKEDP